MTIKQALKYKNKLVKRIGDNSTKLMKYNTIEVGNKRPYDINEIRMELSTDVEELVVLKSKIHLANAPVLYDIFRMSELKSLVNTYKRLECFDGKSPRDRYSSEVAHMESSISVLDRDNIIRNLENEIEVIQDRLDVFNATTGIN